MVVAWAYLGCSVAGALFVVNAYRPPRRPAAGVLAFFAGWPTSELPLWHVGWTAVATVVFGAFGALDRWPGWVGLAATVAFWAGLVGLARRSAGAGVVVERALAEARLPDPAAAGAPGQGASGQGMLGQGAPASGRDTMWSLPRLLFPLPRPERSVRVYRNLDYAGDGAHRHRLDVVVRRHQPPASGAPVLVYLHGGAWVLGDKREQGFPLMFELVRRGWVAVTVNYGLGPRRRWPAQVVDAKRALAWVRANAARFGGDPGFVAVAGGSAGGHLAALLALTPGDPAWQPGFEEADTSVDACVPFYGVYDMTGGGEDQRAGRSLVRLLERMVFPGSQADDPGAYRQASPLYRVRPEAPPFFVLHGTHDTLVPVPEARRFVAALRQVARNPVCYAELPGAQHAFDVLPSVRCAHAVAGVVRFLQAVRHGAGPGAAGAAGEAVAAPGAMA